jgi:putative flavoprotein involved in K+ transport
MNFFGPDMKEKIDTVIVGGGQAGLAMSHSLSRSGREHVVFERSRIAERWRRERWDSLAFQFPNWSLTLPGYAYRTNEPDGFAHRDHVVQFLEEYAVHIHAPIRLGVTATALRGQSHNGYRFALKTDHGSWLARNVVLATGPFQSPSIPACSAKIAPGIAQIHSRDYRNPQQFPPGAVLVVGGGTSGAEIAHELHLAGREVYLSIGAYRKGPRRYRERDFLWWVNELRLWDRPIDLCPDARKERVPLLTGRGGGSNIDLRRFADDGVFLLGRMQAVCDGKVMLAPDVEESLSAGDAWYARFRQMMDDYVEYTGLELPEEIEPDDATNAGTGCKPAITELDLASAGIVAVVWATGYQYDFGWVECPVFADTGEPVQTRGVTSVPGLYFLGLRRMYTVKSALLSAAGVGADAAYLAEQVRTDKC